MENLDQSVSVGENSQGSRKKLRQKTKRELDYENRQVGVFLSCYDHVLKSIFFTDTKTKTPCFSIFVPLVGIQDPQEKAQVLNVAVFQETYLREPKGLFF